MNNIVMGISAGHNRGAAITINGEIKVAISNERITRVKTDRSPNIPVESMRYCLDALGLTYQDIDLFVYNITEDKNLVPSQFIEETGLSLDKLKFIPHHLAHAASSFCASGFDHAAVIVADALGSVYNDETPMREWYDLTEKLQQTNLKEGESLAEAYSIFYFDRNSWEDVYKKWIPYPHRDRIGIDDNEETSIGFKYNNGAKQLVYNPKYNSWQAGKLMGLASYADPEFVSVHEMHSKFETHDDLTVINKHFYPEITWQDDFQTKANVAGLYQREQEMTSLFLAKMACHFTESTNLCVAGGSFLNCNTNEMILKEDIFDDVYFMPPADDSGIPIGCAYFGYYILNNYMSVSNKMMTPYLGKSYTDSEISELLKFNEDRVSWLKLDDMQLCDTVAYHLKNNKVIGWFQGGSEMGPRALGNRSILASPMNGWIVDYINSEIKEREWYRPFAPSVLFDKQAEVFETNVYSPYMLVTSNVKDSWKAKIPAVTHIDGTARYQSVTPKNNHKYYRLIEAFYKQTGVPVVLNTSFNGPEEPIVETPFNALDTFLKRNMYALVMNNYIIFKK